MSGKKTVATGKKPAAAKAKSKAGSKSGPKSGNGKSIAKSKAAAKAAPAPQSSMPMFYNSVVPLNANTHGKLRLKPAKDLGFAKRANSIVLAASEFAEAAMHYPIVFGRNNQTLLAFAITGHTNGENLFVDSKNKWRQDSYIPAYVRRYPFILAETTDNKSLSLAVDTSSEMLSETGEQPLYKDGKPAEAAQRALAFCTSYHRELLASEDLYKQIDESGILVERSADVTLPDDKKVRITGFSIVDEKALAALDDEVFLTLRKSGALTLIFCHLWSMRVWKNLLA